ncbi:MAG: SpoIIE family protein phosphatase [Limnothrix sp.]
MIQILVIDDDLAIRFLLKRTLSRAGYLIHLAENGQTGLEMAIALQPDLVICDWMMPGLSGIEVCEKIKAHPQLAISTFFILLTALGTTEDKIMGLDAGADDFLCKPIEIHELLARVRAVLRVQQLALDLQAQKRRLEIEFNEAAQYVKSILPPPLNRTRLKIDTCFIPSSQLGGDGFDYFWIDHTHVAFYLLDVSGHGLKAALPSIAILNLLRSRQGHQGIDYASPKQVLEYLTNSYGFLGEQDQYFTIWYGVYDTEERILNYASAGHPPAILLTEIKDKPLQLLRTKGLPIGLFEPHETTYAEKHQYIPFDSVLYLFSDGVYENARAKDHKESWEVFLQLLETSQDKKDLNSLVQQMGDRLHNGQPDDDFSMMKLSFNASH